MTDLTFDCMGTHARIVVRDDATAAACREFLEHYEATLSRFRADSELCRLNAAPACEVAASPLLRTAVAAGVWAAKLTGGLVDPTLLGALEAAGYDRDRCAPELPLAAALAEAPPRAAARPQALARWREISVTDGAVRRPPGLRLDTGGTGKGLAADLLAGRLLRAGRARAVLSADLLTHAGNGRRALAVRGGDPLTHAGATGRTHAVLAGGGDLPVAPLRRPRWAVDCGGDLRVFAPADDPFEVDVRHPLTGEPVRTLRLADGAVATSGLNIRLWRAADGSPRHHLLDPATGEPAWTGLIGATALAPTVLEAEALAKAALLSGPAGAGHWLRRHGGITVRDDGDVEVFR